MSRTRANPTGAMVSAAERTAAPHGPWNPGLRSPVPRDVEPLNSLYRQGNTSRSYQAICELSDFSGLSRPELAVFTAERLVVHEVLIRVAADVSVPDGPGSEDLGVNYRAMCRRVIDHHLASDAGTFDEECARIEADVEAILDEVMARPSSGPGRSAPALPWWKRLMSVRQEKPPPGNASGRDRDQSLLESWQTRSRDTDPVRACVYACCLKAGQAVRARHGRLIGMPELLRELAGGLARNTLCGDKIEELVRPRFERAVEAEGWRWLPDQTRPVVMNTKGASAAGKSTQRPRQRQLAERIGISWSDFALVSPDIFRKYLLDYDSLGPAYKYAGMLTSEELRIVDQKLDRHLARKAKDNDGRMPHLLIDRFRFDSFAPNSDEQGGNLLTRFGKEVYLFYLVTPPHETVERAWERGLRVGRYKTVDDLLYHNVEAFSGMPGLFFTWAGSPNRNVHYEFLNNDVAPGEKPRVIACGAGGTLAVCDVQKMLDIDRYRDINIEATQASEVYPPARAIGPEAVGAFLHECIQRLERLDFVEPETARVYLRFEGGLATGKAPAVSPAAFDEAVNVLQQLGHILPDSLPDIRADTLEWRSFTLGDWR